ncbi:MAG TPA: helix-turn-helix transcriptional regulator [Candidatus Acidoferrum sp.]|nr:helix-turn-helix transcriptional regulator [Candidatus Acidoferrum sp.]
MKSDDHIPSLSRKEALVLELLLQNPTKEMYGLEMVAGSRNKLKRGTVYVTLDRMEDKGFVESHLEEPRPNVSGLPRRLYRVTGYGQKIYMLSQAAREAGRLRLAELGGAS